MVDLGVVRCPVCEKVRLYRTSRIENNETVKELASSHLSAHRLDESKHGIYRVMMADHADQFEADTVESAPVGEWTVPPKALSDRLGDTQSNAVATSQE